MFVSKLFTGGISYRNLPSSLFRNIFVNYSTIIVNDIKYCFVYIIYVNILTSLSFWSTVSHAPGNNTLPLAVQLHIYGVVIVFNYSQQFTYLLPTLQRPTHTKHVSHYVRKFVYTYPQFTSACQV